MGYRNEDGSVKVEEDVDAMLETYDMLSLKYFTHATPTVSLMHSIYFREIIDKYVCLW